MSIEEIKTFLSKLPLSRGVEIVHIDESGLVALNKKAGIMSHPNPKSSKKPKVETVEDRLRKLSAPKNLLAKNDKKDKKESKEKVEKTLLYCPYNFEKEYYSFKTEDGEKLRLHLLNRIDSHTSGLILVATNEAVAHEAKLAFKNHEVKKEYLAVCLGRPNPNKGVLRDFIKTENKEDKFVRSNIIESLYKRFNAECDYSLLKEDRNGLRLSLVSLKPTTGKTHQLRIQCANKNIPILGDATYGNFVRNKEIRQKTKVKRLCLHCKSISLKLQLGDKSINFEATAPMPETFSRLIDKNVKTTTR